MPINLEDTVSRMRAEIAMDMRSGRVPTTVKSFSELHDYVDANEYGGFCEDEVFDSMSAHFAWTNPDDAMPQAMIDFVNQAQGAISELLRNGKL